MTTWKPSDPFKKNEVRKWPTMDHHRSQRAEADELQRQRRRERFFKNDAQAMFRGIARGLAAVSRP